MRKGAPLKVKLPRSYPSLVKVRFLDHTIDCYLLLLVFCFLGSRKALTPIITSRYGVFKLMLFVVCWWVLGDEGMIMIW
jgi:hypothetical protein